MHCFTYDAIELKPLVTLFLVQGEYRLCEKSGGGEQIQPAGHPFSDHQQL